MLYEKKRNRELNAENCWGSLEFTFVDLRMTAEMEEQVKAGRIPIRIRPDLERFWGRPLHQLDVELCEVLGWAEVKGRRKCWHLTEAAEGYNGQIYRDGALPKGSDLKLDDKLLQFLLHHQRADLDPFLGQSKGEFHLRLILTLVSFELAGFVRRTEVGGKIEFAATDDLAELWLYPPEDEETGDEFMRPVVRANGHLVWDRAGNRDEDTHPTSPLPVRH